MAVAQAPLTLDREGQPSTAPGEHFQGSGDGDWRLLFILLLSSQGDSDFMWLHIVPLRETEIEIAISFP